MDIFKKFTARAVKLVSGRASAALFCDYAYANEMKTPVHPGYGRGSRNRGALEMEYAADGPEKAEEKIFKTGNTDPKGVQNIHVWYPASMEEGKKYPLLIISNGMEFSCTSFIAILQHLASWGFIAAGNDALNSGSGETAAKTLEKMLSENEKQGSLFHDRIDLDHIGGIGYFQGGAGAIRQATISKNKDHYSALYLASPMTLPFIEKAKAAAWSYDPSQITVPVFIASGGDGIENGILAPKEDMEGIYQAAKGPAVIGRMKGEDHLRVMTRADAYMTAWFRMILSGDKKAASIFGKDGEFMKNAGWTDKSIKGIPLEGNE